MTFKSDYKIKYNLVSMFGYIDVPDVIPVNMLKTVSFLNYLGFFVSHYA